MAQIKHYVNIWLQARKNEFLLF